MSARGRRWAARAVIAGAGAALVGALGCGGGGSAAGQGGGDASAGGPDATTGASDDGGMPAPACSTMAPARAVVMAVNGDTDSVQVLELVDGHLVDSDIRFPADNPRDVAIRADGGEALIAYGGFGAPYGVMVVTLSDGGASAEVADTVEVGQGETPFGVAYASDDHAVLALASPGDDGSLVALDRSGGHFQVGTTMTIPNNWPLDVDGRPGADEAVLARANLASDAATDIYRVTRDGDGWTISGQSAQVAPPSLAVEEHPAGAVLYSATSDPDDRVTPSHLEVDGLLHVLSIDDGGIGEQGTVALPGVASYAAVDPDGGFLVLPVSVYALDPNTGTPIVRSYRLATVELMADGSAGTVDAPTDPFPGLLFHSLQVAEGGLLVTSMEMYPDQAPAAKQHPVVVWGQTSPGAWVHCQTLYPDGQAQVAIAP